MTTIHKLNWGETFEMNSLEFIYTTQREHTNKSPPVSTRLIIT